MRLGLTVFFLAVMFALGLGWSGMTDPQKVIGFLNVLGQWDPSLIFVMGSAIPVYFLFWQIVKGKHKPLWDDKMHVPTRRDIDWKLLTGAAIFGIGWGIGGICPGPGVAALGSKSAGAAVFVFSFFVGGKLEAFFPWLYKRAKIAVAGRKVQVPKPSEMEAKSPSVEHKA